MEFNHPQTVFMMLIPAVFTLAGLIIIPFFFPLLFLANLAIFPLWIWVGAKSRCLNLGFGKTFLCFNGLGIVCLIFAVIWFSLAPLNSFLETAAIFPFGMTRFPFLDILASLYSAPFMVGSFLSTLFQEGNYALFTAVVNSLVGFFCFSCGYLVGFVLAKRHETPSAAKTPQSEEPQL